MFPRSSDCSASLVIAGVRCLSDVSPLIRQFTHRGKKKRKEKELWCILYVFFFFWGGGDVYVVTVCGGLQRDIEALLKGSKKRK